MANALITLKNTQEIEGEKENVELISEGEYDFSPEKALIKYKEITEDMPETKVVLSVKKGEAVLIRENFAKSMMIFEKGRNYLSKYRTPYGDFNITVITKDLKSKLDSFGGEVKIEYLLQTGTSPAIKNSIKITVKPL